MDIKGVLQSNDFGAHGFGRENAKEAGSAVGWERSATAHVGKNLIETVSLSLSEKSGCEKSSRFDIIR